MITIKIGKEEFELPEKWEEVTLGQFVDIANIKADQYGETEKAVKILGILSRTNKEDVWKSLELDQFNEVLNEFKWLDETPKPIKKNEWIIGDVKFGIKTDFTKLNTGEMISLETLLKDNKTDLQPIEIAFGVLFREKNEDGSLKEFNADTMLEIIQFLKDNVLICEIIGVTAFFLNGEKSSITKTSKVSFQIKKMHKTNTPTKKKVKKK